MSSKLFSWNSLPNRDEVMDLIFAFINSFSESSLQKATSLVYITDIELFKKVLDDAFKSWLLMLVDDKEMDEMSLNNLIHQVSNPFEMDEDTMLPTFSNNDFILEELEVITLKLFLKSEISPVRLHFRLEKNPDGSYFLKMIRITSD